MISILIAGIGLAAFTGSAVGQSPAIQIGYVPADTPGPVHLWLYIEGGECGGHVACPLFVAGSGFVSAAGEDASAVMAAIDAAMSSATCHDVTVFEPPIVMEGKTGGEVRHEYRARSHPGGWAYDLVFASVRLDRGGVSLSLRSPCGSDLPSEFTGPYYITLHGVPETAGEFVVWCQGKNPVQVQADPSSGAQAIADAVLSEALLMQIHATSLGGATIGFNIPRYDQDVSGLEYVGMADASAIEIEVGNRVNSWVQIQPSTWGSIKAIYR